MTTGAQRQRAVDWDGATKEQVPCDRKVVRDGDLDARCGEMPSVRMVGFSRGTKAKAAQRCRAHAISSAGIYAVAEVMEARRA